MGERHGSPRIAVANAQLQPCQAGKAAMHGWVHNVGHLPQHRSPACKVEVLGNLYSPSLKVGRRGILCVYLVVILNLPVSRVLAEKNSYKSLHNLYKDAVVCCSTPTCRVGVEPCTPYKVGKVDLVRRHMTILTQDDHSGS